MSKSEPKFNVGDLVLLNSGKKPLVVTHVYRDYSQPRYNLKYTHSNTTKGYVYEYDLKPYDGDENMTTNSQTLYKINQVDGKDLYGVHVGTNSQSQYLIEVKGTGEIIVVDKKNLEEVLPYTMKVKYAFQNTEFEFIVKAGSVKKNDVLMTEKGELVTVLAVDTKCKNAKRSFKGVRLVTESIDTE